MEQIYDHGTKFSVRNAGMRTHDPCYIGDSMLKQDKLSRVNPAGPLILSYNGKYLARLHRRQIRRWASYYGLRVLRTGRP